MKGRLRLRARQQAATVAVPGACLHPSLAEARDCPTCGPTVAVEITELLDGVNGERRRTRARIFDGPTLRVRRRRDPVSRRWLPPWDWAVWDGCVLHAHGEAPTHGQALAVGLAALETSYARAPRRRPDGTRWDVRS